MGTDGRGGGRAVERIKRRKHEKGVDRRGRRKRGREVAPRSLGRRKSEIIPIVRTHYEEVIGDNTRVDNDRTLEGYDR